MPSVGIKVTIWKIRQKTNESPEIDILATFPYDLMMLTVEWCITTVLFGILVVKTRIVAVVLYKA